ncbi:low molecular weight phosphotyrosine protein phosphatase [Seongchinamella sediminis]|uniref:protein-tyrosine-phosphatase n=1 Tax=Seongchinamella sediminis TaxID=2283635 RepID=A0A3L7E2K1_9GAMM|nr:low molecular weight protein-tyrosine-phosphatase [Seongchinamella sediminis]RLQ23085.1 low molecular weight phosphotyrosine protein phosphatase [Seongchinamella sediminis]
MTESPVTRVLFVCLGNICRSPTAHGVFEAMVRARGLEQQIRVDSCGTGDWHIGHAPDKRATAEALGRGYDLSGLRARQVQVRDFHDFDYILAMDRQNLADLQAMCPAGFSGYLGLFLPFDPAASIAEVPDPYYGGDEGFTRVLDMVEAASEGLLREIGGADTAR